MRSLYSSPSTVVTGSPRVRNLPPYFFTIGGDSILALSVRSEAEKRGIAFDIEELFVRPTVAELAESMSQMAPEAEGVTEAFALLPMIDRAALHDAEDAFQSTFLVLARLFTLSSRIFLRILTDAGNRYLAGDGNVAAALDR